MKNFIFLTLIFCAFHATAFDQEMDDTCSMPLSKSDVNICALKSFLEVDQELNRLWHFMMNDNVLTRSEKDNLKSDQIQWIIEKEKTCDLKANNEGDLGSYRVAVYAQCLEKMTKERIAYLEGFAFQ